ncbi:hypothetical protein F4809DRAFT_651714 [Biscogniauxia mediterranea]|nr:hypothetical protein F4809DRAFT_651714 [Biscogniauxia mediterranea]
MSGRSTHIHVAIVGGGITGVMLALALEKRRVDYALYERAPAFTEIGAGIGFSPNAERALKVIDPQVYSVYKQVASTSDQEDYFTWVDGHETNEIVARLLIGIDAFQGGRRSDFLEAWSKLIPSEKASFGKDAASIFQQASGKVLLSFKDGTSTEADVVIGCDGIHSRVRQLILGEANPASYPSYTHKYCFRALVPMDRAREALGEARTVQRFMYNGPDAHCIIYPVAMGKLLNVLLVISDPNPWRAGDRHTARGDRQEAAAAYADWHPHVRAIVDLLPEQLDKWAIFDMFEHPAPYYNAGSVAVAGDAAHASGPHLGSGAGFGIEDALVLATVLEAADQGLASRRGKTGERSQAEACRRALAAYNEVRFDRAQWLAGATREAAALFQWQDKEVGSDHAKFQSRIHRLFHTIWDNDIDEMVSDAIRVYTDMSTGKAQVNL